MPGSYRVPYRRLESCGAMGRMGWRALCPRDDRRPQASPRTSPQELGCRLGDFRSRSHVLHSRGPQTFCLQGSSTMYLLQSMILVRARMEEISNPGEPIATRGAPAKTRGALRIKLDARRRPVWGVRPCEVGTKATTGRPRRRIGSVGVSTLSAAQVSARRESIVAALTSTSLAPIVDLVVWVDDGERSVDGNGSSNAGQVAMAASHVGRVRLHQDGRHEVLVGLDPIAREDPMAFLPYDRECVMPSPPRSRDNAYPYAAVRILSLFADPTRSPDVAVLHLSLIHI